MKAKRKQWSRGSVIALGAGAGAAGIAGLVVVLVLTAKMSVLHRGFADARRAPSEQNCLTQNTVPNMSGQVFVYVKQLCRHVADAGRSPFTDCVFANKALMTSDDAVPVIRARCEAISGGSSIDN
jgi:hypothetical protein